MSVLINTNTGSEKLCQAQQPVSDNKCLVNTLNKGKVVYQTPRSPLISAFGKVCSDSVASQEIQNSMHGRSSISEPACVISYVQKVLMGANTESLIFWGTTKKRSQKRIHLHFKKRKAKHTTNSTNFHIPLKYLLQEI